MAEEYDLLLTPRDRAVRQLVRQKVSQYLTSGTLLDFGGGTGLDLEWLMAEGYSVEFIEPSEGMRAKARERLARNPSWTGRVNIVEKFTDVFSWSDQSLPVALPVDGVLMNFAVLNCIHNLTTLFRQLSLVTRRGAYIVALILNPNPLHVMKHSVRNAIGLLLGAAAAQQVTRYRHARHPVLIHSLRSIKRATPQFTNVLTQPIPNSEFTLIVWQRQ
ncbi:MAG: class I SAM-dependent methyltransferase [Bacteroidia bacterium]|nr:class I SAM-dependent methyltransferase [Bacteroidia bacterium]